jgi:hypothetical protein
MEGMRMSSEIAAALREIADIDEAEGGNPHVIAKEREAASHIEAIEARARILEETIQMASEIVTHEGRCGYRFGHDCDCRLDRFRLVLKNISQAKE